MEIEKKMRVLLELFVCFFKTGLFTFGGGYAMLPILKNEIVYRQKWLTEDELLNYFSLSQCTPGAIAINVATFCGYKLKKTAGALVATLGVVMPSLIIILLIASVLQYFMQNIYVVHLFNGVRLGVIALLLKIVFDLSKKIYLSSQTKILSFSIFFIAVLELFWLKASAIFVVITALLLYMMLTLFKKGQK